MVRASIVVPAYNVAAHLALCVDSLLAQTEESLEVIIVDDGSTDASGAIADRYAEQDARVRVIHQENGGLSAARNAGVNAASGEFLFFLDGDDWAEPGMVMAMSTVCEAEGAQVAVAGAVVDFVDECGELVRSDRRRLESVTVKRGVGLDSTYVDDNLVNLLGYAWNKAYRREWLAGAGHRFEEGLALVEDIEFNARVLGDADTVAMSAEEFVHYVQRPAPSLGKVKDASFLALRLRAIRSVDSLLGAWGVDSAARTARTSRASAMALWGTLAVAADSPMPFVAARAMLSAPGADEVISLACIVRPTGWRERWAVATLSRRWYGVAVVPVRLARLVKRLVGRVRRDCDRR